MATNFRNNVTKNIGTVPVSVYTAPISIYSTVVGLVLANLTESVVKASVTSVSYTHLTLPTTTPV